MQGVCSRYCADDWRCCYSDDHHALHYDGHTVFLGKIRALQLCSSGEPPVVELQQQHEKIKSQHPLVEIEIFPLMYNGTILGVEYQAGGRGASLSGGRDQDAAVDGMIQAFRGILYSAF